MLASRAPPASISTVLFPECISPDIPAFLRSGLNLSASRRNWASLTTRSSPRHGEDEIGGTVTRSHRSLDGGRQPRISPVAGKKQISEGRRRAGPQRILLRRGLKRRTTLAHDLPWRQFALYAGNFADIPPDRLRQLLARHIHQPVAIADGDRQALREGEQPFHQSPDDPDQRGHVLRRIEAEMGVYDRPEFGRRL